MRDDVPVSLAELAEATAVIEAECDRLLKALEQERIDHAITRSGRLERDLRCALFALELELTDALRALDEGGEA